MKLYALVKNDYHWIRFFDVQWRAYQAMWDLKNTLTDYRSVRTYGCNGRNFVKTVDVMGIESKDVYSVSEISLIDALNWIAAKDEYAKRRFVTGALFYSFFLPVSISIPCIFKRSFKPPICSYNSVFSSFNLSISSRRPCSDAASLPSNSSFNS